MGIKSYFLTVFLCLSYAFSGHAFDDLPDGYEFADLAEEVIQLNQNQTFCKAIFKSHAQNIPDSNHAMETLEASPSAIVAGCVNAITGDFFESMVPLSILGPQPLIVQCSYCSSEKEWNFQHMPGLDVGLSNGQNHLYARYLDDNGSGLTYRTYADDTYPEGIKNSHLTIPSALFEKGLTNCGSGVISGKTNWRNSQISLLYKKGKKRKKVYRLKHGSGVSRIFSRYKRQNGGEGTPLGEFRLESEYHPNGNRLLYTYLENQLRSVKAVNKLNQGLAYLFIKRDQDLRKIKWHSGSGTASFYFDDGSEKRVRKITASHAASISYQYSKSGLLVKKNLPDAQFLDIHYYRSGESKGKVLSLSNPLGFMFTFYYGRNETYVNDAEGNFTKYCYDKKTKRLQSIQRCNKAHEILNQDNFYWSEEGNTTGNLVAKTFEGDGKIYFSRVFQYDDFGNVLQDCLFGNLTGKSQPLSVLNGVPTSSCDIYAKTYRHSQDGRNLLLEEHDESKTFCCDYYPNRLLKHRFTKNKENILKREFFEYDENGVLSKETWDDGTSIDQADLSNVTEKHVKLITPRSEYPIGLPEIVEEYYLDLASNHYHLLKKTVNVHSLQGKILEEHHYGSDGNSAFVLKWEYDHHGNVTKKIDALGQVTIFNYDVNDNKILEEGPRLGWYKVFEYDKGNRLVVEKEC